MLLSTVLLTALGFAAPAAIAQEELGAIEIVILDVNGELTFEGWRFSIARQRPERDFWQHDLRRVSARIDREGGTARVEGLSSARYWLRADHPVGRELDPVEVRVESGRAQPVLLRDPGPPIDESLAVCLRTKPRTLELQSGDVYVVRAGSEDLATRRPLVYAGQQRTKWSSVALEPGLYEVVIDHPALRDWRSAPIPTGRLSDVVVESRATVELVVTDRTSRAPVPRYSGFAEPYGERFTGPGAAAPGRPAGTLDVVTGDTSLVVTAWGYAASEIELVDLRLGERRRAAVALEALASLTVSGARGESLELVWVAPLERSQVRPPSELSFGVQPNGRVEAARVAPGRYRLVERGPFVREFEGRAKEPVRAELELHPGETVDLELGAASQVRPRSDEEPAGELGERAGLR